RNAGGVGQLLRPPLDRAIETVETLRGLHLDDRQHQVVAAGEVRVERAAGQAAGLADLLDRGAIDAAHGEDGDPGLDQGGSGLLLSISWEFLRILGCVCMGGEDSTTIQYCIQYTFVSRFSCQLSSTPWAVVRTGPRGGSSPRGCSSSHSSVPESPPSPRTST